MGNDLRYALRRLRQAPGFALTAVLTLALGLGATTAIFTLVEGVLLRPLPFPEPRRLVSLDDVLDGTGDSVHGVTAAGVLAYMRDARGFSALGGYQQTTYELTGTGEPARIPAGRLSASMFPVLAVRPLLGRAFTQAEDRGSEPVALLSYGLWRGRFHADPHILGQRLMLDRKPYTILGVMPRSFEFPLVPGQLSRAEVWVPVSFTRGEIVQGAGDWNFHMVGRLLPGTSLAAAQGGAAAVTQKIMRDFPAAMASLHMHAVIEPLDRATVAEARPLLRTLFLAVSVVLLIACANLAGLLLVRVLRRRRELAVRLALGASSAAILRQTLAEACLLSLIGGLLGIALASVSLRVGLRFLPETLPRISSIGLDWPVAGFALLLALATGLLCGAAPAFAALRTGVLPALQEGGRTGSAGSGQARLRSLLAVVEVAVALVLLVAAGLLLRSFTNLHRVNLGFQPDSMLTAQYDLPHQQFSTQAAVNGFNATLLHRLAHLPGVEAAGITSALPAAGLLNGSSFVAEGYVAPQGTSLNLAWPSQVLGSYLRATGIPLLRGRYFTEADREDSPLVIIVNHALAQQVWPSRNPIGRRIHWGLPETPLAWMTVVGEIGDIKQTAADLPTQPQIYQPASQQLVSVAPYAVPGTLYGESGSVVLRSPLPAEQLADTLRSVVRGIDPRLPLTHVQSMSSIVEEAQAPRRFSAALVSGFAFAALLMALLGVYTVIAFSAALRT